MHGACFQACCCARGTKQAFRVHTKVIITRPPSNHDALLGGIPHMQILHPMPFYRILGFSDFPKIRKTGIPEIQDFRDSRNIRNSISENPDFSESENPELQISGPPHLRRFRFPEIKKFRFSDFLGIGCRIFPGHYPDANFLNASCRWGQPSCTECDSPRELALCMMKEPVAQ